MDHNQACTTSPTDSSMPTHRAAARALLWITCSVSLLALTRAVLSPDLEWRMLALAALAFASGPVRLEVRSPRGTSVRFPPGQAVLFAASLVLGPVAALPAALAGLSRLLAIVGRTRSAGRVVPTVLRPIVVCWASAAAYQWTGGSVELPQQVSSVVPAALAAVAYVGVAALLAALGEPPKRAASRPRPLVLFTEWSSCLAVGYALAALYAAAPTYVLIAPAVAATLAGTVARQTATGSLEPAAEPRSEDSTAESDPSVFVDAATGLATRRYLEMFLASEIGRAERFGKEVSLAVFDLDGFAHLYESGGSETVNAVMAEVGAVLKAGVREYDIVARYSAGRLAVALPESGADQAFEVAERLHTSVASVQVGGDAVSVSVGVASYPEHASTADELVNSAHRALNRGRFEGLNRVYACRRLDKAS